MRNRFRKAPKPNTMKTFLPRIPALFVFTLISMHCSAQDILWEKSYGGKQADFLMDAQPTPDYGFIMGGSSLSGKSGTKTQANQGSLDYWLWKMDEGGELEWQKAFGGSGSDLLQSIGVCSEGGFILAGVSSSGKSLDKKDACRGQDDFWIIRLNPKGDEQWQLTLGGAMQEKLHSIKQTRDGGFILGGSSASGVSGDKTTKGFGNLDYWLVKLDRSGKTEWQQSYGGQYVDELRSVEVTVDGGYLLGGYSNSPASGNKSMDSNGAGDYWIIKTDKDGKIQWQKSLGGSGDEQLYMVRQTYDKGYILGGNSNSDSGGTKYKSNGEGTDFWLVKLDETGEILWQETYNYAHYDVLTSLIENPDHSLLIGGFAKGEINGNRVGSKAKKGTDDYIALKVSETGQELWSEQVGSDGEEILRKVIETRDGGYVLAGTSNPQGFPLGAVAKKPNGIGKGALSGISHTNGQNQAVQDTKKDINQQLDQTANEANQKIKDNTNTATNAVKDGLGMDKDSPVKLGAGDASPLSLGKVGDGKGSSNSLDALGGGPVLPRSGDKKKSFGNSDFWVVKLLDRSKPKPERPGIEAYPNPSEEFTNILVGYDFESGTATVADMAGRVLQSFEITSRTVPIDLSPYPEGIYVVNIKTNVQSNGVKVMRKGTRGLPNGAQLNKN